jgi:transcriptional regulator with PAS, ATPase and Fis domain
VAGKSTGKEVELPIVEALQQRSLVEIRDRFLITKSGNLRAISGNIAPLRGPDGGPGGAVIMFEAVPAVPTGPDVGPTVTQADKGHAFEFGRFRIVAASEPMKQVLSFALRVAKSEATTVLLEGESGTGKDLMAQIVHYSSSRSAGPFVALNCSALPEALLESELFGREPGAYTDARTQKKGLLEVARGGTLFLDEVGDLSPAVQAKFLRVLEQQSFRRLGGVQEIEVDLRVIAATNRDLSDAVQSGAFRLDLFHRLSVIQIAPPPLREHPEDILPLAKYFVQEYNRRYKVHIKGISEPTAKILNAYDWPGNVRQLRNVIERAMLLEETNVLQRSSIQFASARAPRGVSHPVPPRVYAAPVDLSLKNSERTLIVQALEKAGGNKTKAAALLGVSRDILRHRMKKLNLLKDQ